MVAGLRQEFAARADRHDADRDGWLNPREAVRMMIDFGKETGILTRDADPAPATRPAAP
jgi:hypothetical protein